MKKKDIIICIMRIVSRYRWHLQSSWNSFGLMLHPERAYYSWQLPDWTRMENPSKYGDGRLIFESMVEYLVEKL